MWESDQGWLKLAGQCCMQIIPWKRTWPCENALSFPSRPMGKEESTDCESDMFKMMTFEKFQP
jgi:hypothetical protein